MEDEPSPTRENERQGGPHLSFLCHGVEPFLQGPVVADICSRNQYQKDGRCCSLCEPGKKLSAECSELSGTVCVDCDEGEFQDRWSKETYCHQHSYCDTNAGFEQESEGTTTTDVKCRCQLGRHCSSGLCETCILNSACEPGYRVSQEASRYSDTVCSPCPNRTFTATKSHTEKCQEWTRCNSDETEEIPGSSVSDVVCEPQPRSRAGIIITVSVVLLLVTLTGVLCYLWYHRNKAKKGAHVEAEKMNDLENGKLLAETEILKKNNIPEEDNDPELPETTVRGHPVAQEEGKDFHMSQEEN
uniref:Tumor necrosis factor receptor superfamily member 5 n=1 Tax=Leptobrachium leishanense TaxID=445787 RepID=A0A8C5R4U3_9ANUR